MKDTAIYDFVHHQHQQSQQHHQQWNHPQQQLQRQLQQANHNGTVYGNQSGNHHQQQVQRTTIGQQQQHHHHQHLNQYHHNNNNQQQHFQPATHHNNSAYYQQSTATHLYPNYQTHSDQQQESNSNVQQHGHHDSSNLTTIASASGTTTNAAVAGQQLASNNTQQSSSINSNWSSAPGSAVAPSLVAQHLVMNEHNQVPGYVTHEGYHSAHNNSTTTSEHRNHPNVPVSSQSTMAATNGIQDNTSTNSYAPVNPMYNIPMGSATETYGYSNYNTGFFQASPNNNSHNPQTVGHPSNTTNISTFWSHNQPTHHHQSQQQSSVGGQSNQISQRHQTGQNGALATENYVHDPRLYYTRPTAYNQNIQSYLQPQLQSSDILDQGIPSDTILNEPHQHLQQNEQLSQIPIDQQQQPPQNNAAQTITEVRNQLSLNQQSFNSTGPSIINNNYHSSTDGGFKKTLPTSQNNLSASVNNSPQHHQKQPASTKIAKNEPTRPVDINKQATQINRDKDIPRGNIPEVVSQTPHERIAVALGKSISRQNGQKSMVEKSSSNHTSHPEITINKQQLDNEPQNVIHDKTNHYQQNRTQISTQPSSIKDTKKENPEDNDRTTIKSLNIRKDEEVKTQSTNDSKQQSPPNRTSLEDSIASMSLSSPRKTTWASIASQPAKVSQPKSLKSKIAGSNSVLSTSAKHHLAAAAAASAVSLEASNLELKNGINPAIKNSVSTASTSIQVRNSMPPPSTRLPSVAASLKLDLIGKDSIETSKISWPAVNASIDLTKDNEVPPKSNLDTTYNKDSHVNGKNYYNLHKRYNDNEDYRPPYRDQIPPNRDNINSYQRQQQEIKLKNVANELFWSHRNEQRRDFYNRDRRDYSRRNNVDFKDTNGTVRQRNDDSFSTNSDELNHKPERQEPAGIRDQGPPVIKHYPSDHPTNRNGFRGNNNINNNQHSRPSYNHNIDFDNRQNHNHFNDKNNQQYYNPRSQFQHYSQNNQHHNDNNGEASKQNVVLHHKKILPQQTRVDSTNFNPKTFNLEPVDAKYFIIKSYSEDDIHRSIKYSIWTSTNHGNQKLDQAFRQQRQQSKDAPIYLFFSVNASGHFCGMAEMMSSVDFNSSSGVWAQSKWQGEFKVKWIYVKDVPNMALRHVTLENNEDKPVTNSRDTQEVPSEKGKAVLKIIHEYQHTTSLFDDFQHYERRQEEERFKKNNTQYDHQQQQPPQPYNFPIRNDRGFGGGRPIVSGNSRPYSKPQRGHF